MKKSTSMRGKVTRMSSEINSMCYRVPRGEMSR